MSNKVYRQVLQMSFSEMIMLVYSEPKTDTGRKRKNYAYGLLMLVANYMDYGHYDKIEKMWKETKEREGINEISNHNS